MPEQVASVKTTKYRLKAFDDDEKQDQYAAKLTDILLINNIDSRASLLPENQVEFTTIVKDIERCVPSVV